MSFRPVPPLAAATAVLLVTGCSGPASAPEPASTSGQEATVVTFRLWDEAAAAAYQESFATFEERNPGIDVQVEVLPWDEYWAELPLDLASGEMADVFLMNAANYARHQIAGDLVDVSETLDPDPTSWQEAVVDLYSRDGSLWGVPQTWDTTALFYNQELVDAAGIDPARLHWGTAPDTLLGAGIALTRDAQGRTPAEEGFDPETREQYGFNAENDQQAVIRPFLASAGGQWAQGDRLALSSPAGAQALGWLSAAINEHHIAPPAEASGEDPELTRRLFTDGRLGLYQSGNYDLQHATEALGGAGFGIAPLPSGPEGATSVVHGLAAVGNAASEDAEEIAAVLAWLGTAEGQLPLADDAVGIPAAEGAQQAWLEHWSAQGVDASPFLEAADGAVRADSSALAAEHLTTAEPHLLDILSGKVAAAEGLRAAQNEANGTELPAPTAPPEPLPGPAPAPAPGAKPTAEPTAGPSTGPIAEPTAGPSAEPARGD